MAGRGKPAAEDRAVHPRVLTLAKNGKWQPARDPIHFDKRVAGVGLGLTFGKVMATENPQTRIGLVPCAIGGSSIKLWVRGGFHRGTKTHPYDDTIRRASLAMRDGTLRGILWHQGESDAGKMPTPEYRQRFQRLIADLRRDLRAPNVPFVAGELGRWREDTAELNATLSNEAKKAGVGFVSSEGLSNKKGDAAHFDARSLREFGRRFAKVMAATRRESDRSELQHRK